MEIKKITESVISILEPEFKSSSTTAGEANRDAICNGDVLSWSSIFISTP
jgi:hypothetical protein